MPAPAVVPGAVVAGWWGGTDWRRGAVAVAAAAADVDADVDADADAAVAASAAFAAAASFSEESGRSFAIRAACCAMSGVDGSCRRSSPGEGGWVTDSCRERREDLGGSDDDEEEVCASSLRRGVVNFASRPRLAFRSPASETPPSIARGVAFPELAGSFVCPSSSEDAPATATAIAATGSPTVSPSFVPTRRGDDALAAALSALSRRDDNDDDDVLADGDRFAPPRLLLAIPPDLVDGGTAAPVA